jgi:hypothetical protein
MIGHYPTADIHILRSCIVQLNPLQVVVKVIGVPMVHHLVDDNLSLTKTDGEKKDKYDEQRKKTPHGTVHPLDDSSLVTESSYNISTPGGDVKGFCTIFFSKKMEARNLTDLSET